MRLDKFLCDCGFGTRKEVKNLIQGGAVSVNGTLEKDSGKNVDKESNITVKGKKAVYREYVYIMMNKPSGFVSATEDKKYPVVVNLLSDDYRHFALAPVGRLDIDTEGLLILTNDGKLNHELTSPKKNVYKTYYAVLDKEAEESDIDAFANGMEFKEFTAKSAILKICENKKEVYISIAEGKFHQVKRMCERVGKTVTYLKRISIGKLTLDEKLAQGEYRELTEEELNILKFG